MEITVNISKSELDLIEESLLQYYNILMRLDPEDELVRSELTLLYRVVDEFGIKRIDEVSTKQYMSNSSKRSVILNNPVLP